jgi:hypothetical protein
MTKGSSNNSLSDSYSRFSGPNVTLTSIGSGPNIKSKKQSALERYEAELAVREKEFEEQYGRGGSVERRARAERDVSERLNPGLALKRKYEELFAKNLKSYYEGAEKKEAQNRANYNIESRFRGAQGGTEADYQKWRNLQEIQSGSDMGRFLASQRAAQIRNPNDPDYRYMQQIARGDLQRGTRSNDLF